MVKYRQECGTAAETEARIDSPEERILCT